MLISAARDQLWLHSAGRVHSYSAYYSVGVLAAVLRHKARIAEINNLQGFYFWFDLASVDVQYLDVCTTVL